jgi:hypothetical protein
MKHYLIQYMIFIYKNELFWINYEFISQFYVPILIIQFQMFISIPVFSHYSTLKHCRKILMKIYLGILFVLKYCRFWS